MSAMPAPLVPAEVDLRGMDFMPLKGDRLFASATWIGATADAKVAALRLWWHAFAHEVPAASLPDDDALLADYAGYGVAIKAWLKVKKQAMRGWKLCSDGRWYHHVVAELALEAWAGRVRNREKQRKWRERNQPSNGDTPIKITPPVTVTEPVTKPFRNAGEGQLQSQLKGQSSEPEAGSSEPPQVPQPSVRDSQPEAEPDDPLEIPLNLDRSTCGEAVQLWNDQAKRIGLPIVQRLTDARRRKLFQRLVECSGIAGWKAALAKVEASPFLCGSNDRGWRADIDFMLRESRFTSLMEGKYDGPGRGSPGKFKNGFAELLAEELAQSGGRLDIPDGRPAG